MVKINRLREMRLQQKLAQQAVAVRAGTNDATIVAIERYGYLPGADLRKRIAQAVGVEESDIWPELEAETAEIWYSQTKGMRE